MTSVDQPTIGQPDGAQAGRTAADVGASAIADAYPAPRHGTIAPPRSVHTIVVTKG
jgi:hypothetical protein